jgi:hypothetical protein
MAMNSVNKEAFERRATAAQQTGAQDIQAQNIAAHEIEALLPWHAAGTLNRRDAERVNGALSADSELARRFALVREELNETIHLNESLGAPSTRCMERVFAAIDAEGAKAPARRSFDFVGRIASFMSSLSPRTLAYGAGVACIAIAVQGAVLTGVVMTDPSSQGPELASAETEGGVPQAVVRFSARATVSDITRFLDAHKVTVIDGPRNKGFYTLRLSDEALAPTEVAKMIRDMQNETNIVELIASKN